MTPKQQRFVEEYLIDLNSSAAARRAGYTGDPNTIGPRLLANVGVAASIAAAQQQRSERTKIDADWVLQRLVAEAEADVADLYDEAGKLKPVQDWPKIWRTGLVVGLETVRAASGRDEDGSVEFSIIDKVRHSDRIKRLELIGKHVNVQAFKDRLEVEDVTDRAEQMRQARAKRLGQG